MTADVIIAGAGPNGLLTACELALAGVRPVVLERLGEPSSIPKSNGLIGRVVQALDQRGLYELFGGEGIPRPVPSFQFGALWLNMAELEDHVIRGLPVPQRRMEELLAERARELGVEIRRRHELVSLCQDAERVTLTVRGAEGPYELAARFLVGADGGQSAVRKACGIGFPGITDRSFVHWTGRVVIAPSMADPGTGELDVPGLGRLRPYTFTRTATGMFAVAMFQPGVHFVGVFEWSADAAQERPDVSGAEVGLDELREALGRVLGTDVPLSAPPDGVSARCTTMTNSRQAERYRDGRVFLVGDAAHVHSSVGGPGLNLGMLDALNLGWKLAAAVHGWAPPGLLDSYHTERYPVGERVLMHSRAQIALLLPGPNITALRQVLEELLRSPENVRHICDLVSGADTRYDMGDAEPHELTGRWLPDLALQTADGPTRVAHVMRSGRPVLLDLAGRADLVAVADGWADRVDVLAATTPAPPADALLVRPDGHVAWAGGAAEGLRCALCTWFGRRLPGPPASTRREREGEGEVRVGRW